MRLPATTRASHSRPFREAGISLLECLVYIAIFAVIFGLGLLALYHTTDNHKRLRRNADDVAAAVNVGERWREDIRAATGNVWIEPIERGERLHVPQADGEVIYEFAGGELRRREHAQAPWTVILPRVASSRMAVDSREHTTAWRWELTLQTKARNVRVQPMFTFSAVPKTKSP